MNLKKNRLIYFCTGLFKMKGDEKVVSLMLIMLPIILRANME